MCRICTQEARMFNQASHYDYLNVYNKKNCEIRYLRVVQFHPVFHQWLNVKNAPFHNALSSPSSALIGGRQRQYFRTGKTRRHNHRISTARLFKEGIPMHELERVHDSSFWPSDIQSVPGGMDKTSGECSLC